MLSYYHFPKILIFIIQSGQGNIHTYTHRRLWASNNACHTEYNNVGVLFFRESLSVGQPITRNKLNLSGQSTLTTVFNKRTRADSVDDLLNQEFHMELEPEKSLKRIPKTLIQILAKHQELMLPSGSHADEKRRKRVWRELLWCSKNAHSLTKGRRWIQYNSKRRESENIVKHSYNEHPILPTQTRRYVVESLNKLIRCKIT